VTSRDIQQPLRPSVKLKRRRSMRLAE